MNLLAIIFIACVSISTASDLSTFFYTDEQARSAYYDYSDFYRLDDPDADGFYDDSEFGYLDDSDIDDLDESDSSALPVVDEATSTALPVVDEATYTCQEGYELDGVNCRQLIDRILRCPHGAVGSNIGDKCVVDNKFCSLGHLNTQATVEDRTERECDEGYTFATAANRCVKRVYHGPPKAFCVSLRTFDVEKADLIIRNGQCIGLKNQKEVCSKTSVLSKPGCLRRTISNRSCGCEKYYKIDPTNREKCIFIEGSPERFCDRSSTKDPITDKCQAELEDLQLKTGCEKGDLVEGRCEEVLRKLPEVLCPLELASSNAGGSPQLTCFKGTVKETVKETGKEVVTEKRCLVTRNVQPELLCPIGSSASSINPTKCKSDVAIPADVITATTTTITFADVAADVDSGL